MFLAASVWPLIRFWGAQIHRSINSTDMNSAHCQVHKNKLKFPQKAKVIQQGILQLRADGRTEAHKTEEFPT